MPPFNGVVVKLTFDPKQIVVAEGVTETEGVSAGFTVMVIPVLVAVVGDAQVALEVNTTVNTSEFEMVLVAYVLLVATAITAAFFFHW